MSYPFLVKRGFNRDATSPWHNFLEGVQCAAGPEEARAEGAKPAWSNSLARWETGLDVGSPGCLAAFSRSVKKQTQSISLLLQWEASIELIYITVALLCLVFLCLACYVGNCLSMCENGYRMQSCCCDRILENEIRGFYSVGLVKFWDSCKTASAVFSTCIHLLKCALKIFYAPQHWSLTLARLSLKRFNKITGHS